MLAATDAALGVLDEGVAAEEGEQRGDGFEEAHSRCPFWMWFSIIAPTISPV